jgi:hypothetical protein
MKLRIAALVLLIVPFFAVAQDAGAKKQAYFFYLETCPHCHNVDKFFTENGIYDKYDIKKLDASIPQNGQLLMKLYEANSYSEDQRGGVPVIAFGDKFFVGDKPIIDNFVKEIDASSIADQLPNPEKDGSAPDIVVHDGPLSAASANGAEKAAGNPANGNESPSTDTTKKNYVPLIIAGIVVVGAGALIVVNRNK